MRKKWERKKKNKVRKTEKYKDSIIVRRYKDGGHTYAGKDRDKEMGMLIEHIEIERRRRKRQTLT